MVRAVAVVTVVVAAALVAAALRVGRGATRHLLVALAAVAALLAAVSGWLALR